MLEYKLRNDQNLYTYEVLVCNKLRFQNMKSIIFPKSAVQLNDEVIVITFSNIGFKKIFFKIQKKAGLACTRQIIVSEEDLDSPNYYRIIGNQSKLHKKKHCFYNDPLIHLESSFYMYLLFCNQNMRSLTN